MLLRRLHRWVGLAVALLLLLEGLTGLLLVLGKPLDRALARELFVVQARGEPISLDAIDRKLVERFGTTSKFVYRPPRSPGESLLVHVDGDWRGQAFFDPYSGARLGERAEAGTWFDWLFELHAELLAGEIGRAILAVSALAGLVMIVSGYLLWWPARWRNGFRIRTGAGQTRLLSDLHRVGGALAGLLIAVSLVSGLYMGWRPLSGWVSAIAGAPRASPPTIGRLPQAANPANPGSPAVLRRLAVSPQRLIEAADAALPGGKPGYLEIPADPGKPVRVRKRMPEETHPNGLSMVWLDPDTAEVLRVVRHDAQDPGTRLYQLMYPLHIGELGGLAHEVLTAAAGAALAGLVVVGTWLWWLRRRVRARRAR